MDRTRNYQNTAPERPAHVKRTTQVILRILTLLFTAIIIIALASAQFYLARQEKDGF